MEKRRIRMMRFEACSRCQYDCEMCAHGEMRKQDNNGSMSMEQMERFLHWTRESGYFIENLRIHGGGEPLLWEHFNEALPLLKQSGVIGTIFVATNGLLVHKIPDEVWECIDEMRVSIYNGFTRYKEVEATFRRFPDKIILNNAFSFVRLPKGPQDKAPVPCQCRCDGPMLLGDRIYLYCGPPVFGAAEIMGASLDDDRDMWVDVGPDYLEHFDARRIGTLDYCAHCWGNGHFDEYVTQSISGGNWK